MDEVILKNKVEANRKLNLAYILAGTAAQSFEIAEKALDWNDLQLIQSNKQLVNEVRRSLRKLIWLIEELHKKSVLTMELKESSLFEDSIHMYFALFMAMIDRSGLDELSDKRLYNLYNKITQFKPLINFNFGYMKEEIAFNHVLKEIRESSNLEITSEGDICLISEDGTKKNILEIFNTRRSY